MNTGQGVLNAPTSEAKNNIILIYTIILSFIKQKAWQIRNKANGLDPVLYVSFKFVNVEIYVLIPIIAHGNEYPGTRPLKLLPTRSHITGNIENTNWKYI